ncbi:hypothetical protein [Methylopila sp. M107]|uniref:hypothetical protein n=1 Tax=Methylopila sp. M107 TaxID=1101190 RepID=UPI000367C97B|nr:hypothetical protein [Methylopila sp. M107]
MTIPRWLSSIIGRKLPGHLKEHVGANELHELVRFTNDTDQLILLVVEPWADQYWIKPSATVTVMTDTFPLNEASPIEFSDYCVSVYWRGEEVLYVFENGIRVKSWLPRPDEGDDA